MVFHDDRKISFSRSPYRWYLLIRARHSRSLGGMANSSMPMTQFRLVDPSGAGEFSLHLLLHFSKRLRTLKVPRRCLSPLPALRLADRSNRNIPRLVRRLCRATQESAPGWLRMRYQALGQLGGALPKPPASSSLHHGPKSSAGASEIPPPTAVLPLLEIMLHHVRRRLHHATCVAARAHPASLA